MPFTHPLFEAVPSNEFLVIDLIVPALNINDDELAVLSCRLNQGA